MGLQWRRSLVLISSLLFAETLAGDHYLKINDDDKFTFTAVGSDEVSSAAPWRLSDACWEQSKSSCLDEDNGECVYNADKKVCYQAVEDGQKKCSELKAADEGIFDGTFETACEDNGTYNPDKLVDFRDRSILVIKTDYPSGTVLEIYPKDFEYCPAKLTSSQSNMSSTASKGILYLLVLLYLFFGVAIVADIFMSAIEVITSQVKEITDPDDPKITVEINVWNETVANLTLLALGSSAPEILLSVIEAVQGLGHPMKPAGELGPSTIVGSAAFNLFMIIAVCMISVPPACSTPGPKADSGIRKISQFGVFLITAFASVFAYLWMYICIDWMSVGVITITEAVLTLMMFPTLVIFSYLQDVNFFENKCPRLCVRSSASDEMGLTADGGRQGLQKMTVANVVRKDTHFQQAKELLKGGGDIDEETLKAIAARSYNKNAENKKRSYMVYRVNAIRGMTGKKAVVPAPPTEEDIQLTELEKRKGELDKAPSPPKTESTMEFNTLEYAVREDAGSIKVAVLRKGNFEKIHRVNYTTVDGSARAGEDYVQAQGVLVFNKGDRMKTVEINILEDDEVELDEFFFVTLSDPAGDSITLGAANICTVKILDVSHPGRVGWKHKVKRVQESSKDVKLSIVRKEGAQGDFFVKWKAQDGTALNDKHYKGGAGTVKFEAGEILKDVRIPIIDNNEIDATDRYFEVILYDPSNENMTANLLEDKNRIRVDISDDEKYSKAVNQMINLWGAQKKRFSLSTGTWKEQFEDACAAPYEPQALDFFLHALAFPWKMLFAFIPPTDYMNGWLTFYSSLAVVGIVTMLIGDVAATFGCFVGLSKAIVAITVVALGTSMPDTFASRTATMMAPDADAAVGNVTGSNSVNVFLGLGLPWVISSFFAKFNNDTYRVVSPTLGFSVMVFSPCAIITLGTLFLRRIYLGGELGGSPSARWMSFSLFLFLWIFFIFMCFLVDKKVIPTP